MGETDTETSLAAAHSMIDIFVSVGAGHFHVTWTSGEAQPRRARSLRQSLAALGNPLPHADNPDWLDDIHIACITAADLDRAMPALLETALCESRLVYTARRHPARCIAARFRGHVSAHRDFARQALGMARTSRHS
jgi:hypothetical protein